MTKTTIHENVTFGARGRKWTFEAPGYTYVTPLLHGGRATADKVARIINGGSVRTKGNGIDNLAKANMSTVFHNAAKAKSRVVTHLGTFDR